MKLTDLNTAQDIGANCLFFEMGPFRWVVDCGIHPKKTGRAAIPSIHLLDNIELDFIVLTHAHLDHVGALPLLHRRHPLTPILCTPPTKVLAPRMLRNSYNVMLHQREQKHINEYPLYTKNEISSVEKIFFSINFHLSHFFQKENETLQFTFHPSGHLPGAAGCLFIHKHRKVFLTGDVSFTSQLTVPGAQFPKQPVDVLITETTRGVTQRPDHSSREEEAERLIATINRTISHGGSCLLPLFALGRTQEMLAILNQAKEQRKLVKCPIFTAGLGMELIPYFTSLSKKTPFVRFDKSILKNLGVQHLPEYIEHDTTVLPQGLYLLSSGMMVENTPSYVAALLLIENHLNSICFVGYCDPETPGGELLATHKNSPFNFKALRRVTTVKASIEKFDLSSHADRDDLIRLSHNLSPRTIVLTHGDPSARAWFEETLTNELPKTKIINPIPSQEYSI